LIHSKRKMKKTLSLLGILLLLGAVYLYLSKDGNTQGTVSKDYKAFVLEDPSLVAFITIKEKDRPLVHLSNKNGDWYLNDKHRANSGIVENILVTMNNMSLRYIPTYKENQTALKRIDRHGIEVATFDAKGKPITDFMLGTNISSEYGTYCALKNSSQVYVMHLPAVEGGIRSYFTATNDGLRDQIIFRNEVEDIEKITCTYPKDKSHSFVVEKSSEGYRLSGNNVKGTVIQNYLQAYVKDYIKLVSVGVKNDHFYRDSITQQLPFMEVIIENKKREPISFEVYPMKDIKNKYINTKSPKEIDKSHEEYFVYTSDEDFYLVQGKFLNKLIKSPLEFCEY